MKPYKPVLNHQLNKMEPSREEINFFGLSKAVRPNQYNTLHPFLVSLIMSYRSPANPDEQDEGRIILQKNHCFLTDKVLKPLFAGGNVSNTLLDALIPTVTCELENPSIFISSYLLFALTSRSSNEILLNIIRTSNKCRLLVAPIVRFKHCVLLIANRENKQIVIYDSAGDLWAVTKDGIQMGQYIRKVSMKLEELLESLEEPVNRSTWNFQYGKVKKQSDESSCGIHTTIHASLCYLGNDRTMRPEFSDENVTNYRGEVLKKLLIKQLFQDSPSYVLRILKTLPEIEILDPEKVELKEEEKRNVAVAEKRKIRRVPLVEAETEHPDWKNCMDYKTLFEMFKKKPVWMKRTLKHNPDTIQRWLGDPNFNFRGVWNRRRLESYLRDAKHFNIIREALAQVSESDSSDSD